VRSGDGACLGTRRQTLTADVAQAADESADERRVLAEQGHQGSPADAAGLRVPLQQADLPRMGEGHPPTSDRDAVRDRPSRVSKGLLPRWEILTTLARDLGLSKDVLQQGIGAVVGPETMGGR
jgi:hypothetical protein